MTGRSISQLSGRRRLIAPVYRQAHKVGRVQVLPMWETFLIQMDDLQMDDFDRLLELQLRRKLDAVVASPVPVRRGRAGLGRLTKADDQPKPKSIGCLPIELRPETFAFVEQS